MRSTMAEPSATDAVERVLDAGERLVTERIELARLEVEDALAGRMARIAGVVVPALFAFGGWWLLMAGVAFWLQPRVGWALGLTIVGAVNVIAGGAVALARWQHAWAPARIASGAPR